MVKIRCQNFGHVGNFEGNFSEKNSNIGGATTTPLLSAECQIEKKSALKLTAPRV